MQIRMKRTGDVAETLSICTFSEILNILQGAAHSVRAIWLDAMHTMAIVSCADEGPEAAVNFFLETDSSFIPVQTVTGDVAFVRFKESVSDLSGSVSPELADLSQQDIEDIDDLLSEERQIELSLSYFLYGG